MNEKTVPLHSGMSLQLNIDTDNTVLDFLTEINSKRASGDFNNMLPVVEVAIPDGVVISCPMARQSLLRVKNCLKCTQFNGVVQIAFNDKHPMQWDHKYAISCGFPVDRRCSSIFVDEG